MRTSDFGFWNCIRLSTLKVRSHLLAVFGAAMLSAFSATAVSAPQDFNGDGKSDLVFRNGANGQITGWLMNGATASATNALVGPGSWTVSHIADFNGDGKADLLFRNDDGSVTLWIMNGLSVTSSAGLIGPDPNWFVTHVGDFDGDGKADLLWRNANGAVTMWLMNGTTVKATAGLTGADPNWSVTHVGDFNGDGKTDILWRNTNGSVTQWIMFGTSIATATALLGPDPNWSVAHLGDFNGDGKADILWRSTSGAVTQWLMFGTSIANATALLGPDPNWSVTHIGDFNGDGKSDILWRNLNGAVTQWLMFGTGVANATALLGADPNWQVTHLADLNGDNKADLVWRNESDGSVATWLMNGTAVISKPGILAPSAWSTLPSPTIASVAGAFAKADVARLLSQATFGASQAEIDRVYGLGLSAYLDEQFAAPQTSHLTTVRNDPNYPLAPYAVMMPSIWKQYFEANDQLRQRVVSALSQILVISQQNNTLGDQACGTAAYLDMLGRNAFGNFRNLLKEMTVSPAMGEYLDMKQSAKADSVLGSMANENYARELLQLFAVGTVMLNQDGSVQFNAGKPVPSYTETTVQEFSRALTGWTFAGQDQTLSWRWLYPDVPYPGSSSAGAAEKACVAWSSPMVPWKGAKYKSSDDKREITGLPHDSGAKTLLVYPGSANYKQSLPANQTPEQDLEDVVDNVFNHPNVGPFIAEQLIQRLVTSNPNGAYISRVAGVFNNNGAGVRGDMRAVIRAILVDSEARLPVTNQPTGYGKLREPIQRFTQLHRAFDAKIQGGYYNIYDLGGSDSLGQSPVRAPSVFNYYSPDFAPSGTLSIAGLVGPEFEITNSATISGFMDFSKYGIIGGFGQYDSNAGKPGWINPNYTNYIAQASNPAQMVDSLNLLLMAGSMSSQFRAQLINVATRLTDSNATTQSTERFKTVLWLIISSPEYSIQK
jgi:uncharacterized protein (DUF1800 family)